MKSAKQGKHPVLNIRDHSNYVGFERSQWKMNPKIIRGRLLSRW